jgi:hypothetical protein
MASAPRSSLVTFVGFLLAACGSGASDGAPPGPVDAARSTLAAAPTSAVADGVATVTLSATARDAGGVPLGDRLATFTVSGSDNLLSVASATTDAAGAASVALTSTRAEDKVVSVVVDGVAVAQQAAVTFEAGPAASLALSGSSGQVTAGTVATVGVAARDAYGNLAKGYRGTVHFASTDAQAVLPAAIAFEASDAGQRIVQVELRTAGAQVVTATDQADPAVTGLASAAVAPAAAAALAFAVQPSGGVAGEVFTPAVRVALFDAYGNLATSGTEELGLTLSGGAAGAILTGGGATATVNGEADFPGLWVDKAAAGYQLAATSVGLAATTSVAFAITAAAPDATASTVSTAQASVPAGEATAVTASLRDLFANPAPGVAVTFAATGEGNTIMQPSAATDAAGVAIGSLTSTRAEAKTLSAVAGAVALAAQPVVNFYASAVSPADSTVVASPTTAVADGSTPATVTVTLVDAYGNPMSGWSLQFATSRPAEDVLSSSWGDADPNGVAIFTVTSATAGTSTLSVRYASDFDTLPQTAQVTFVAGPVSATASTVVSSLPTVPADGVTSSTVTVTLRDATANPVSGKVVTLASSRGAADAIAPSSGISDDGGAVTFEVRSSTFGSSTFSATDDTDSIALLATAQVDFRSYLVFATQPADAVSGALLDPAPVVAAQDAAGNTDAAFAADVTLALGTNPVSGTLTGTLTVPAGAGVATFPDLQLDKAGAGYTLVATSPAGAMAAATSSPFAVVAGSPARLVFTLQPSDSGAGIEPMLQVAIHDAAGNLTAVTGLPVTVALDANPSGATLDGTLTSPSFDGVATFSGLGISAPGQGYTLVATVTRPTASSRPPASPSTSLPPTVVGLRERRRAAPRRR